MLLAYNDQVRWDDIAHTDAPIGTTNLVASQNDYQIKTDDNSLDILNITKVRAYPDASTTTYYELDRINANDSRVAGILSPDTTITGTPSGFIELGNVIYLDILPSYSATNGLEIFFSREQSYFTVTGSSGDDTAEPGIPKPFHELLAMKAALTWNEVNRNEDTNLLQTLIGKIREKEVKLKDFIDMRNPTRVNMTMRPVKHR
jgi:hypothetical protein